MGRTHLYTTLASLRKYVMVCTLFRVIFILHNSSYFIHSYLTDLSIEKKKNSLNQSKEPSITGEAYPSQFRICDF